MCGHQYLDADATLRIGFGDFAEIDIDARERQRMAHRNQFGRALGGHHRADIGNGQHIALLHLPGPDTLQRGGLHAQDAAGNGRAWRGWFFRNIDHARAAGFGKMSQ